MLVKAKLCRVDNDWKYEKVIELAIRLGFCTCPAAGRRSQDAETEERLLYCESQPISPDLTFPPQFLNSIGGTHSSTCSISVPSSRSISDNARLTQVSCK